MTVDFNKTRIHDKRGKRPKQTRLSRQIFEHDAERTKLTADMINMPSNLDVDERKAFKFILNNIIMANSAYANDATVVEMLCHEYMTFISMRCALRDEGITLGMGDKIRAHPLLNACLRLGASLKADLKQFNMTPGGRKFTGAPQEESTDEEWDEFLN